MRKIVRTKDWEAIARELQQLGFVADRRVRAVGGTTSNGTTATYIRAYVTRCFAVQLHIIVTMLMQVVLKDDLVHQHAQPAGVIMC